MFMHCFHCECILCEAEKETPVVDYTELRRKQYCFYQEKIFGDNQLLVAKNIIAELEKIYSKYDKRVTDFYCNTLSEMVTTLQGPNAFMVSVPELNEFAEQVEENVRITYGIDHKHYKRFLFPWVMPETETKNIW